MAVGQHPILESILALVRARGPDSGSGKQEAKVSVPGDPRQGSVRRIEQSVVEETRARALLHRYY